METLEPYPKKRMQLSQVVNRRYLLVGGILLFTLWLWTAFDRPYPRTSYWSTSLDKSPSYIADDKDVFNPAPLDSEAIRTMCKQINWNKTLIFTCDNNHGGVGHVRNSILNCVRYSIAAGASLVLPNIAIREIEDELGLLDHHHDNSEEEGLTHAHQEAGGSVEHTHEDEEKHSHIGDTKPHLDRRHGAGRQGLEYMFDVPHFKESLRLSCPQLTLIDQMEQTASGRRHGFQPESVFRNHPVSGLEAPEDWSSKFFNWVNEHVSFQPQKEPIVVDLEQSILQWPTHSDGHGVAHVFGDILKFRHDVRHLATTTLVKLSEWYDLPLNLTNRRLKHSFLGAHLRTEVDSPQRRRHAADVPYTHYENQAKTYLEQAKASKIPIIYVTSGNMSDIHRMIHEGAQESVSVTHKFDLLKGSDRDQLQHLTWDQRALVDFLVVMKAQEFAGVGHSTFSWNVAMKRHEYTNSMATGNLDEGVWSDGLSKLYGVRKDYVQSASCMWP